MSDPEIILIVRDADFEVRHQVSYVLWRHAVDPGSIVASEIGDMLRQLRARQAAGADFKSDAAGIDTPAPDTDP